MPRQFLNHSIFNTKYVSIESQYIKNKVPIKVSNQLQTEIIYKSNKVYIEKKIE